MKEIVFVIDESDKRNYYIKKSLVEDGYTIKIYQDEPINDIDSSKLYIYVFAPKTAIDINVVNNVAQDSWVFALDCSNEIERAFQEKSVTLYKYVDDEMLTVKNAYLTAEGSLAHLILGTEESVKNKNILVLGYGRVAKAVVKILKDIEVNVYVAARSEKARAEASIIANYVCDIENCTKHLKYFSAIVNTIPDKVIGENELTLVNKDCFILDLASKPGGVDFESAKTLNIKTMHALGVPGKTAPKTAAYYLKESIYKKIYKLKVKDYE